MPSDPQSIAKNVREEVEKLLELAMNADEEARTADQVERELLSGVLALGRMLMQMFFAAQSEREIKHRKIEKEGKVYRYQGQPARQYYSIFGKVRVKRYYYWNKGEGGYHPLDEKLSLPERIYSDYVQDIMGALAVWIPEDLSLELIRRCFGLSIPKKSLQASLDDQAQHVHDYYDECPAPEPAEGDTIQVVSGDGKGIPMTQQDSPPPEARRRPGQRKTATKEATVTASYTITPYIRSPDDIINALLPGTCPETTPPQTRPSPTGKQVAGTLAGQKVAFEHLKTQVSRREHSQIVHRVALTDGNRGLKKQIADKFPTYTLVLDIIHVIEYLWKAAHALLGDSHPLRETWMTDALRCLLEDDLDVLLQHLDAHATSSLLTSQQQETLTKVASYLRNNRDHLDYQAYLQLGYPIGTGVIEGTCRHLVNDRFEGSGMHWSQAGAQSMLALRATFLNGDWDAFQQFRRARSHQQRYGSAHPGMSLPEFMLSAAA